MVGYHLFLLYLVYLCIRQFLLVLPDPRREFILVAVMIPDDIPVVTVTGFVLHRQILRYDLEKIMDFGIVIFPHDFYVAGKVGVSLSFCPEDVLCGAASFPASKNILHVIISFLSFLTMFLRSRTIRSPLNSTLYAW